MKIVIVGAGIAGMTLAALLHRSGHQVEIIEKAGHFGEVGAGIQISPNGARVLAEIGLGDDLARIGTMPERIVLRRWEDDTELLARRQGTLPIERYGHPYFNVYRPDLIEILTRAVVDVPTRFGATVVGVEPVDSGARVDLADGPSLTADVVIGADGIHSVVRAELFGSTPSRFSGSVAFRALVPREKVAHLPIEVTNRMGPDRHLVSYFVGEQQRWLNLVCVVPEPEWDVEGWNEPGSLAELRLHFANWSPEINAVLDSVVEPVHRWALHDREPMEHWSTGHVALMGDACHAMLPFMAQGACQGIEDAAILDRLLSATSVDGVPEALVRYEDLRRPRAAEIQRRSRQNATLYHLPDGPDQETRDAVYQGLDENAGADAFDWLYGHDSLTVSLWD